MSQPRVRCALAHWERSAQGLSVRRLLRLLPIASGLLVVLVAVWWQLYLWGYCTLRGSGFGPGLTLIGAIWVADRVALGATRLWRRPLPRSLAWLRLGPEARGELRCAICHAGLGGVPLLCRDCGASYHPRCAEELEACATLGCAHARRPGAGAVGAGKVHLKAPRASGRNAKCPSTTA